MIKKMFLLVPILFLIVSNILMNISFTKASGLCADCVVVDGERFDCEHGKSSGGDICKVTGDGQKCTLTGPCGNPN